MTGQGQRLQAFCRVAAVAGALYVLRCSLTDVIIDSETGRVTGVQTAAGQTLSCEALVSNVDLLGRFSAGEHSGSCGSNAESPARLATSYVDRAVAVTDRSIVQVAARPTPLPPALGQSHSSHASMSTPRCTQLNTVISLSRTVYRQAPSP